MRSIVKKAMRDEKGAALVLTLVLLLVGGLVIAPLLGFMGTGIIAGEVHEKRMDELYAADGGVEDAFWKIHTRLVRPPRECGDPEFWSYNISDINGNYVEFDITYVKGPAFLVESEASTDDSGTRILAYIVDVYSPYSDITDHILVSREGDLDEIKKKVTLNCAEENAPYPKWDGSWPKDEEIEMFYWEDVDVDDAVHYYEDTEIDLEGVAAAVGPLYVDGQLDILNSDNKNAATLTLTGTLYITGDTLIGMGGQKNLTLELNGKTIFVESPSAGNGNEALQIGDRVTIKGPGAIVAIGDIYFAPNGDAGDVGQPVFLMSVSGTTRIRPGITIYGAVAGNIDVTIQSGDAPTLTYPEEGFPDDLNFPGFVTDKRWWSIASWTVHQN